MTINNVRIIQSFFFYHFKIFISSTLRVALFLNKAIMIARPTAASAAATAITKNTNICPTEFPIKDEKVTKLKFAELSINSIDIKTMIAFLLVSTPATPTTNIKALSIKKYSIGIFIYSNFFFANTNAPIVAANSKKPAASTGKIYFENKTVPILSIVPAFILASTFPGSEILAKKII